MYFGPCLRIGQAVWSGARENADIREREPFGKESCSTFSPKMPPAAHNQPDKPSPGVIRGSAAKLKLPSLTPRKPRAEPENLVPVPETPELPAPPDLSAISPLQPSRRILSREDLDRFTKSPAYSLITSFVFSVSESCVDTKISSLSPDTARPVIRNILGILTAIEGLIDDNPPQDQGASRFGNPTFRDFIDSLSSHLPDYHRELPLPGDSWLVEAGTYLEQAFGSRSRIDYGSGHELNFAMWLLCLNRLGLLEPQDFSAIGLLVFPNYVRLLRKVQSTYYLEPAGSHGVWGLDDYHFLPFLFGASQLLHHPYIRPRAIHNELVLEEEAQNYLYLDMVKWTMDTKTVKGLKWTQPMLDDISGAKNWAKVEQGMRRMFVKEVLGKLPIMQHFLFGSLIPATEDMSHDRPVREHADEVISNDNGVADAPKHIHSEDTWGDCCGIKLPSTVAASEEAKKHGAADGLRRIPFD